MKAGVNMTIGELLIKYRREHNLSQRQFAAKCNNAVTNGYISMIETGNNPTTGTAPILSLDKLKILASGMDITLQQLIDIIDDTPTLVTSLPDNLTPISEMETHKIPIIGTVAAGEPIFDSDSYDVYIDAPLKADFALTVDGDSMEPTYYSGDVVYIKAAPDVYDGQIAVVIMDSKATLKHVYHGKNTITLISDNPKYAPMIFDPDNYEYFRVVGYPVGYTRMFNAHNRR